MPEEQTAELGSQEVGQPEEGPAAPTTQTGPETMAEEQSAAGQESQTTDETAGPDESTAEETFFDPASIQGKPELEAAYKQMQGAFTKKMQGIKGQADQLALVDQFNRDPIGTMTQLAQRMGYQLTPAQAAQAAAEQQGQQQDWEPKSWDDVIARTKAEAKAEVIRELQPVLNQFQNQKKTAIEQELSAIDPTWHLYEGAMAANLQKHPTMVSDPALLYQMSVPAEVQEKRATQKAIAKLQAKAKAASVSGSSTTNKQPQAKPTGPMSFAAASALAIKQVAEAGIRPGE